MQTIRCKLKVGTGKWKPCLLHGGWHIINFFVIAGGKCHTMHTKVASSPGHSQLFSWKTGSGLGTWLHKGSNFALWFMHFCFRLGNEWQQTWKSVYTSSYCFSDLLSNIKMHVHHYLKSENLCGQMSCVSVKHQNLFIHVWNEKVVDNGSVN